MTTDKLMGLSLGVMALFAPIVGGWAVVDVVKRRLQGSQARRELGALKAQMIAEGYAGAGELELHDVNERIARHERARERWGKVSGPLDYWPTLREELAHGELTLLTAICAPIGLLGLLVLWWSAGNIGLMIVAGLFVLTPLGIVVVCVIGLLLDTRARVSTRREAKRELDAAAAQLTEEAGGGELELLQQDQASGRLSAHDAHL